MGSRLLPDSIHTIGGGGAQAWVGLLRGGEVGLFYLAPRNACLSVMSIALKMEMGLFTRTSNAQQGLFSAAHLRHCPVSLLCSGPLPCTTSLYFIGLRTFACAISYLLTLFSFPPLLTFTSLPYFRSQFKCHLLCEDLI